MLKIPKRAFQFFFIFLTHFLQFFSLLITQNQQHWDFQNEIKFGSLWISQRMGNVNDKFRCTLKFQKLIGRKRT
jgi:hypothetical protein